MNEWDDKTIFDKWKNKLEDQRDKLKLELNDWQQFEQMEELINEK